MKPTSGLIFEIANIFIVALELMKLCTLSKNQTSDKMSLVSSKSSRRSSSSSVTSRRAKAACLQVEMDFLEGEAEYKKLVMQK